MHLLAYDQSIVYYELYIILILPFHPSSELKQAQSLWDGEDSNHCALRWQKRRGQMLKKVCQCLYNYFSLTKTHLSHISHHN